MCIQQINLLYRIPQRINIGASQLTMYRTFQTVLGLQGCFERSLRNWHREGRAWSISAGTKMSQKGGTLVFWEQQLLGKPPLLLLPTDKPRTSSASSLFQVPSFPPSLLLASCASLHKQPSLVFLPSHQEYLCGISQNKRINWEGLSGGVDRQKHVFTAITININIYI